jgi:hypothetical protein
VESDYCDDLAEIYQHNGTENDVIRYKGIHLMDKGTTHNGNDEVEDKYQCPDTGSHFEFLEMCHRLKKLQKRRNVVDNVLEEEDKRQALMK